MSDQISPAQVVQKAFPGISPLEAETMVSVGKVTAYPDKVDLCVEGAVESIFYIILDGQVRVTKVINASESRFLGDLEPGDFFGEMALIHNAPRVASVATLVPTTVLEIHKEDFESLVRQNSAVSLAMVREVSRRLRENNDLAVESLRMKASELATAYQQLAELEMARSEFLTVVAHEMRTPLTVANGFLQMVRAQRMSGEALQSALDTIARNLQDITALVNDLLFLQEMDIILPEFQPVDLSHIVAEVVDQERERAQRSQVGLKLDIPSGLPRVSGDARSLRRAVAAVVDNAIKFSPDGGDVVVQLNFDENQVWARIADHGVGIPPADLPRVFDRFFHLEQVGAHLFRGLGLGLSIANQVIQLHHGRIGVASELGKGSVFTIYLPRA
jgi:signal transduction histidine kinase